MFRGDGGERHAKRHLAPKCGPVRKSVEFGPVELDGLVRRNACGVTIIAVVASNCWHLLAFSKQQQEGIGANDKMFSLGRHQRDLEQVMLLYRNGRDACSFGTFFRIGHFRKEGDGSLGRHASQI